MGTFDFVITALPMSWKQANAFGDLLVQAKFRRHNAFDSVPTSTE